jgi:phage-related minor tail protein
MSGLVAAFAKRDLLSGVGGELQKVNGLIEVQEVKIKAIKNNGLIGSLIDDVSGTDINLEKNKLDSLYKKQEELYAKLTQKQSNTPSSIRTGPSQKTINDFIGASDQEGDKKSNQSTSSKSAGIKNLTSDYDRLLEQMNREIALHGETSQAAKIEYEILNGSLKDTTEAQQLKLLQLASEQDNIEINTRLYEEQNAVIEEGLQLAKKQQDEIDATQTRLEQKFNGLRLDLNAGIADVADAKSFGIINEDQAKIEFDKLGQAYNDSFIDPAKKATDDLSLFAEQAAKNMQTSFADFLFDPFADGTENLVENFITSIRKMVAQIASQQIIEGIFGKTGISGDTGGLLGQAASGLGSFFSSSSKSSSNSGGSDSGFIDTLLSLFSSAASAYSANGNIFSNGSIVPFAKGDIFNSPTSFPMAVGKTGIMGEAGPEAIMPLARGSDGKLGIKTNGNGGHTIIVNVQGSHAPDVRRAAGQGAREALGLFSGASRYG